MALCVVGICQVRQVHDFHETGRWDIEIKDLETETVSTETFDGVIVCSGHHAEKHMPYFEGEEHFLGRRVHTQDYRSFKGYEDKRIVVIGIGNSGGDVAVELARVCKQVYLSTRSGSWVTKRVGYRGIPNDYIFARHFIFDLLKYLPGRLVNFLAETALNMRFNHKLYGLQPKHRYLGQHVMVNDDLPNRIVSGEVVMKPNIRRITKTGVEFEDGSFEDDINIIIYATGYVFDFPFIEHKALAVKKNEVSLFKYVFPPAVQPPTIAIVGCVQPFGAVMPISEMQGRLAVKVFKGECQLPSVDQMWEDITDKKVAMAQRFHESQRHTIEVDYVTFMDELARLIGCRPSLWHLLKTDPRLAFAFYCGPCTPCLYRLTGPNSWSAAKETIMSTSHRVTYPFQGRAVDDKWSITNSIYFGLLLLSLAVLIGWLSR